MDRYIALHSLKKSACEVMKFVARTSPEFAPTMPADKAPAKCLKTWDPIRNGRTDYVICLWEADKPEDINASMGPLMEYFTLPALFMKIATKHQNSAATGRESRFAKEGRS